MRRPPIRMVLIFWLFVLSAIGFMDRTNISIAAPEIRRAWGLDNVHLGWVFSAFLIGYGAFQVVGGWFADRFGSRRALAYGVLWWGAFTALTATVSPHVAHALLLLIVVRASLGAGEAVTYPASNHFVAQWIPVNERGRANGWIFAGVGAGAGLTAPLIAWIVRNFGWHASFWFSAVLGVLAGLVWYLAARDTPEEHPLVSKSELAYIQANRAVHPEHTAELSPPWHRLLFNRNVLAMTASYFGYGYVAWIFFSWFFLYLVQARGLDLKSSAFLSMIPFLAMTVCCLAGGVAVDWLSRRVGLRWGRSGIAIFALSLTAVFLVLGPHVQDAHLASLVLAGGAGSLYLAQSSYWAVSADISGKRSGLVSGFMNAGAQAGGALTASLTPYCAGRYGWNAAFLLAAALVLVCGLLWFFVDAEKGIPGLRRSPESALAAAEAAPEGSVSI